MESAKSRVPDQKECDYLFERIFAYLVTNFQYSQANTADVLLVQAKKSLSHHSFFWNGREFVKPVRPAVKISREEAKDADERCEQAVKYIMEKKMDVFGAALKILKLETRAAKFVAEKDVKGLLILVVESFLADEFVSREVRDILDKLEEKFFLSNDLIRFRVIPKAIALQAVALVHANQKDLLGKFPEVKDFFCSKENSPVLRALGRGNVMFESRISSGVQTVHSTPQKGSPPSVPGAYLRFIKNPSRLEATPDGYVLPKPTCSNSG